MEKVKQIIITKSNSKILSEFKGTTIKDAVLMLEIVKHDLLHRVRERK